MKNLCVLLLLGILCSSLGLNGVGRSTSASKLFKIESSSIIRRHNSRVIMPMSSKSDNGDSESGADPVDETTKKYGFEAGMMKSLTTNDPKAIKPQDLLKKYGIAYLATSITLALISFALCYLLIANGVDVSALLSKIGINAADNIAATNAGTLGLAYAVHKAASPIRFPPTVALTPIVANWLGSDKGNNTGEKL